MAQIRLTGKPEEIERIIQSFSKHYEVLYVSKEYGKTNPKYKYAKDSRVYIELKLK
ncbi:YvzF family protein [Bacillus paralicheniformis]